MAEVIGAIQSLLSCCFIPLAEVPNGDYKCFGWCPRSHQFICHPFRSSHHHYVHHYLCLCLSCERPIQGVQQYACYKTTCLFRLLHPRLFRQSDTHIQIDCWESSSCDQSPQVTLLHFSTYQGRFNLCLRCNYVQEQLMTQVHFFRGQLPTSQHLWRESCVEFQSPLIHHFASMMVHAHSNSLDQYHPQTLFRESCLLLPQYPISDEWVCWLCFLEEYCLLT